jgi:hypothetical protein
MPAAVAPLIGFAIGAVLAWVRTAAHRSEVGERHDAWVIGLFALLVFTPASGYFLLFAGDWSYAYLVDAQRIPSAVQLTLLIGDAASVLVGFWVARRSLASRAPRAIVATLAVPAVLALAALLALSARLSVDASYEQFQGGYGATPLAGGRLGAAILWMDLVIVLGAVLAARALRTRTYPAIARAGTPPVRLLGQPSQVERRHP